MTLFANDRCLLGQQMTDVFRLVWPKMSFTFEQCLSFINGQYVLELTDLRPPTHKSNIATGTPQATTNVLAQLTEGLLVQFMLPIFAQISIWKGRLCCWAARFTSSLCSSDRLVWSVWMIWKTNACSSQTFHAMTSLGNFYFSTNNDLQSLSSSKITIHMSTN